MKSKYFLFILLTLSIFSFCFPIISRANLYSLGVNVDDVFTWKITQSTIPGAEGRTMKIKIIDIENTTDMWTINYDLKDWADYDYDGYIHLADVGKAGQYLLSYFSPLPVLEYLQEFSNIWGWKNYSSSENSIIHYDEKWSFDTKSGILISYSSDAVTYTLNRLSESIHGYDLTVMIGLIATIIVVFVYIVVKKKKFYI